MDVQSGRWFLVLMSFSSVCSTLHSINTHTRTHTVHQLCVFAACFLATFIPIYVQMGRGYGPLLYDAAQPSGLCMECSIVYAWALSSVRSHYPKNMQDQKNM